MCLYRSDCCWFRCHAVTRERAFFNAIQSAGITLALARSCSRGLSQNFCACGNGDNFAQVQERAVNWTWGACSDNYIKGQELAKDFLDRVRHKGRKSRQMAAHNFAAGRKVIRFESQNLYAQAENW